MNPTQAIIAARDLDAVLELSRHASLAIPDASEPMDKLLDEYQAAELGAFHDQFYSQLGELAVAPTDTHEVRIPDTPACVLWLFEHPNDALLKQAAPPARRARADGSRLEPSLHLTTDLHQLLEGLRLGRHLGPTRPLQPSHLLHEAVCWDDRYRNR